MSENGDSLYTCGDVCICISYDNVKYALRKSRALLSKREMKDFPLSELAIVVDFLEDMAWPYSPHLQTYAVVTILIETITEVYNSLRTVFGLQAVLPDYTYEQSVEMLGEDLRSGSLILIGWGWLYFHYVRPEFHMTEKKFSAMCHVDERSARRYQEEAIMQLTLRLIAMEREALKKYTTDRTPDQITVGWEVVRYRYRSHEPRIESLPQPESMAIEEEYISIWD